MRSKRLGLTQVLLRATAFCFLFLGLCFAWGFTHSRALIAQDEPEPAPTAPSFEPSYTPLFSHRGAVNPIIEGWIPSSFILNEGIAVGPVLDDGGVDAWMVDDDSTRSLFVYAALLLDAQARAAVDNGWKLSATMRVVDRPDPDNGAVRTIGGDASPFVLFRDGQLTYQIHFKTTANGDLYVYLLNNAATIGRKGLAVRIRGGADRYLQYDLIYNANLTSVDFYINEQLAYSGYVGADFPSVPIVMWGTGTTSARGQGNFSAVSFEVVYQ